MPQFADHYRNHVIFATASGPSNGPWVAAYSVWTVEPANTYRAILQNTLGGKYVSTEIAHSSAVAEARACLDALRDGK